MRILIPSYDFKPMLGGVANYVHEIASHLTEEHGAQVTVMARQMDKANAFDSSVNYKVIRYMSPQSAFLSLPFAIPLIRKLSSQYDAILCPLWFPDATATYLALQFTKNKIPFHVVVHGSEIFDTQNSLKTKIRHRLIANLKQKVFKNCQSVITVSEFTRRAVLENTIADATKIHVVHNGVNLKIFKKTGKKTQKTFHLITVSRLVDYKGIDVVLKSLPLVLKKHPDILYSIVGTGPDEERLKRMTKEFKIEKNVQFLGAQSKEFIVDLYNSADLFIMMSRQNPPDVEGFGLVFLEAAACGTPSIGGRSGGIPDVIDDGLTGWLLDPMEPTALAHKLNELITQPLKIADAGDAALQKAQKNTWSQASKKIWDIVHG